jgi:hypothetical protein
MHDVLSPALRGSCRAIAVLETLQQRTMFLVWEVQGLAAPAEAISTNATAAAGQHWKQTHL